LRQHSFVVQICNTANYPLFPCYPKMDSLYCFSACYINIFAAKVLPVHVVEIAALYSRSPVIDMEGIYQQINSKLDEVKDSLVKSGVSVQEAVIKDGNPKKVILEIGGELDVDLIILGAKKKNFDLSELDHTHTICHGYAGDQIIQHAKEKKEESG
jgi:hypothetical protein